MSDWRVGKLFLTFDTDRKPSRQGYVLREAGEGAFEIGFFSWIDGHRNSKCVKPAAFLEHAEFFTSDEDMVRESAKRMGHDPDQAVRSQRMMKELEREEIDPAPSQKPKKKYPDRSHLRKNSKALRFKIFKRDHFTCTYCGKRGGPGVELEVDHIVALANGGKDEELNLTTSCHDCNRGKRDKPLEPNA
jgi:hypothetical protein